ncbi:DUF802 domain-containing protein [Achromobacter piechaudii]|uniref:DUF802 domain-containing protein n=1 Tax=Achromobacter piechaudii TaxID=72556 RepID=A0ABM8KW44_9BURK|nr:DUF802 domain-containing protein [Achromobacter piechaudii]CAB3691836.1 hypothetical protein LMG1873_02157 [Achromobacter piechaudii]CAB3860883.1 hypothetical protein LMG2828_02463 [Achromobacter piechaudii]CAB3949570.1 hypothetical protein LMG6103_02277 [Achromobacter piechaudii]
MSKTLINFVVFVAGLAVVGWIGAGYAGSNPLALAVTLLIGVCYLAGAWELLRYQQATSRLAQSTAALTEPPASLGSWLDQLPANLRNAVRLRVEGERVGLPGPALAPYLVGLLVLLGMLGTFLGMVVTLRGTGMALESATDLGAIRASLAAPVKGLGFAFGTSIAGVATSAMLGLLAALCRRERVHAAQLLDSKIATTLRVYSQSYQREESFKLLQRQAEVMQRQAEAMPTLVDRLQAMMQNMEQQTRSINERQMASQDAFQGKAEAAYARLASVMEQSMKEGVAESARSAGVALQPVVQATMESLSRETASLQDTVAQAVQQQLSSLTSGFQASTANVADIWNQALAGQQRASETLAQDLRASLDRFAETFEQRSAALLDGVSTRLEASSGNMSEAWSSALSRQERASEKLAGDNLQALTAAAASFEQHSASLLRTLNESHALLQSDLASRDQQRLAAWTETLGAMGATLREEWQQAGSEAATRQQAISDTLAQTVRDINAQAVAQADVLQAVSARMEAAANQVSDRWNTALDRQGEVAEKLAANNQQALTTAAAAFEQHSTALLRTLDQSHADLQAALAAKDSERLAAWTGTLTAMAATLGEEWKAAGAHTVARQQEISDALTLTALEVTGQTEAQARLLESVSTRLETAAGSVTQAWTDAQARQQQVNEKLAADNQQALTTAAAAFEQQAAQLLRTLDQSHADLQDALASKDEARLSAWTAKLAALADALGQEWELAGAQAASRQQELTQALERSTHTITAQAEAQAGLLQTASTRMETAANHVTQAWTDAQARQEQVSQQLADGNQQALETAAAAFAQHSESLLQTLDQSHAKLQASLAAQDDERLAAWTGKLAAVADTLAQTANDITAQTQAHASETIAEIGRLVQAASEAPKAAAEVIGELRQKLSDSMVRDNDMQEERNRLLGTLDTLLNAVNHTAAEQRTAVDALVASSAELLERVGAQFTDRVEAETGKLTDVAAHLTTSAVEVASLGESFGTAVQLFGESNDKLVAHLQRIEAALDKSIARGDEQLSYYVAQAREVVDLSLMSQKQIIENLQQLAAQRAAPAEQIA